MKAWKSLKVCAVFLFLTSIRNTNPLLTFPRWCGSLGISHICFLACCHEGLEAYFSYLGMRKNSQRALSLKWGWNKWEFWPDWLKSLSWFPSVLSHFWNDTCVILWVVEWCPASFKIWITILLNSVSFTFLCCSSFWDACIIAKEGDNILGEFWVPPHRSFPSSLLRTSVMYWNCKQ